MYWKSKVIFLLYRYSHIMSVVVIYLWPNVPHVITMSIHKDNLAFNDHYIFNKIGGAAGTNTVQKHSFTLLQ